MSDYLTIKSSVKMSADIYIHGTATALAKKDASNVDEAILYTVKTYTGGNSNAAYQMCMATEFYQQDTGNKSLFNGKAADFVNSASNYGVEYNKNNKPVCDVTVTADGSTYKNRY